MKIRPASGARAARDIDMVPMINFAATRRRSSPAARDGGTEVFFSVDFAFRSRLFEALAGQYFDRAFRRMVAAFETRAHQLYGNSSSSSATSVV